MFFYVLLGKIFYVWEISMVTYTYDYKQEFL